MVRHEEYKERRPASMGSAEQNRKDHNGTENSFLIYTTIYSSRFSVLRVLNRVKFYVTESFHQRH